MFINDTANTKLFIFECVRNGSERAIEISGTDINELEKVISSINVYDEFYVVPNAVSDEAGIMFELFQ